MSLSWGRGPLLLSLRRVGHGVGREAVEARRTAEAGGGDGQSDVHLKAGDADQLRHMSLGTKL